MGKYMDKKQVIKKAHSEPKHIFEVKMRFKGKTHTEKFSIQSGELSYATSLGLFKEKNGYIQYLDWKPLGGARNIDGGVKAVKEWQSDDKYIYAVTENKVYSLPKYLERNLTRKDFILFGKREE